MSQSRSVDRRSLLKGTGAAGALAAGAVLMVAEPARAERVGEHPAPGTAVPPEKMRAVYEQVKTPYVYGMVVRPEPDQRADSGSVFRHGDAWYMVHVVYRDQGYDTQLRRSTDLLHWELVGDVLPRRAGAFDSTQAAGYIALQDTTWGGSNTLGTFRGRYWMSYIAGNDPGYEAGNLEIGVASTPDPTADRPWDRLDRAVLSSGDVDVRYWERAKLYKSNIVEDPERRLGARFVMYYNATTGTQFERIGMALSDDMTTWRRYRTDPVVVEGKIITGDPQVVRIGELWVMFFFVRDSYDRPTQTWDNFACSTDLVNWTIWEGEALLTATRPVDRQFAHKPWVIKHDGVVYHFYTAIGDEGWGVAVATSADLTGPRPARVAAYASYTNIGDSAAAAVDGTTAPADRWTAYRSPNDHDWLAGHFSSRLDVASLVLDIYDDGGGVQPPDSYVVQYLSGATWVDVRNQQRSPRLPTRGRNRVTFTPVTTQDLRVVFTHPGNDSYSGVTEISLG